MLIPISHEDIRSRRWPVITIGIAAVCVVALIVLQIVSAAAERAVDGAAEAAQAYYDDHPYLTPSPPLHIPTPQMPDLALRGPRGWRGPRGSGEERFPPLERPSLDLSGAASPAVLAEEQAYLDSLCAYARDLHDSEPIYTFGYVPARNNWLGLFTHMFLHGGWLHLIGNLWFLWLAGITLEDRWGRRVFLPFFIGSGIVAAFAHKLLVGGAASNAPLVGASGAIAGAMGAFLVCFATTRIKLFYVYFRWGTFQAPAYVMLPLWFLEQLVWATIGIGNTAYWAHVGGFLFGVGVALALRFSGWDKKLDDAVEDSTTELVSEQDPRLSQAGQLIDSRDPRRALAVLDGLAAEQPAAIDVQLEILRAAKLAMDRRREGDAYSRLIALYLRAGLVDAARSLYAEVEQGGLVDAIARDVRYEIASQLARMAERERAAAAFGSITKDGFNDDLSVRAAVAQADLCLAMGRESMGRALLEAARESPFSTPELDVMIDGALAKIPSRAQRAMG